MIETTPTNLDTPALGGVRLTGRGPEALQRGLIALALAALAFSFLGLRGGGASHFMLAYVTSFTFYLTLSLGGLFFVLMHHLTGARWSIVLRRLAESFAMLLPLCLLLFLPVLGWLPHLYRWANPAQVAADPVLQAKAAYLNAPFFILRALLYFAVWIGLAMAFYRRSTRQDAAATADPEFNPQSAIRNPQSLGDSMRRISAPGTLLFAFTITFAAFDWLMTLDARWYSTIFGVYLFAGSAVAIYAVLILTALALNATGYLQGAITVEHYHDLGKLLFAFVVFWAYIAFSQLLLIWMGNIPEETLWYGHRWHPPFWRAVSWLLIFGHFALPFLFLLPRTVKRTRPLLALGAAWMLLMHLVDLGWLVLPTATQDPAPVRITDLFLFAGMGCLYFAMLLFVLQRRPLIPVGDPRLSDSIAFENA